MTTARRFSLIYGIVFLLAGIAGFIPGLTQPHSNPDMAVTAGLGTLLGLFAVNILHNGVHLLFGAWGLLASKSDGAARTFGKVVFFAYALLAVIGLIGALRLNTLFGLVPLYGHDVWLHALLAAGGAYFGFAKPMQQRIPG